MHELYDLSLDWELVKDFLFNKVVEDENDCWNWQGKKVRGYGKLIIAGRSYFAHRLSYWLMTGDIPDGLLICHRCDNPACINPEHLFLGTQQDNVADMMQKKRGHFARINQKGVKNLNAKLSLEEVRQIRSKRKEGWRTTDLARLYNVSGSMILGIVSGKYWKDFD